MIMMKYIWLTNTLQSRQAGLDAVLDASAQQDIEQDASLWEQWLADKAIGEPLPSEGASVEQLKAQGYVGVYKYVWS
jgi:hypothetical protein